MEIVQSIQISPQMPNYNPTILRNAQNAKKEINGMHIGCFTNVDYVLILNKCTEYLKESGHIGELWTDI